MSDTVRVVDDFILVEDENHSPEAVFNTVNDMCAAKAAIEEGLLPFCIGSSVARLHPEHAKRVYTWWTGGKEGEMPALQEGE